MKALLLCVLLANISLIFWEMHSGKLQSASTETSLATPLLTVSQWQQAQRGAIISSVIDMPVWHLEQSWPSQCWQSGQVRPSVMREMNCLVSVSQQPSRLGLIAPSFYNQAQR